jgi:hypothetical protein
MSDPLLFNPSNTPSRKGVVSTIFVRILTVIVTAVFDFILDVLKGAVTKCLKFIQSWMIKHSASIRRTLPRMTWLLAVLLVICVMIVGVLLVSISATSTCIV